MPIVLNKTIKTKKVPIRKRIVKKKKIPLKKVKPVAKPKVVVKTSKPGDMFNAQRANYEKAMNAAQKKGGSNGIGVGM